MFKVMGKGHFTFAFCLYKTTKAKIITYQYPTKQFSAILLTKTNWKQQLFKVEVLKQTAKDLE